jgi:hypothetical protein
MLKPCGHWSAKPFALQPGRCQTSSSSFAQNLSFELSEDSQQPGHGASDWCRQIQSLSLGNETDAEMCQFLEGRQQIRDGPAPAVQTPDQHDIDLAAASGLQQFLTSLSLRCTRANLPDLHGDVPAPPCGILAHGSILHGKSLLVVGGHTGIKSRTKHFCRFS